MTHPPFCRWHPGELMSPQVDLCFYELLKCTDVRKGLLASLLCTPPSDIIHTDFSVSPIMRDLLFQSEGKLEFSVHFKNYKIIHLTLTKECVKEHFHICRPQSSDASGSVPDPFTELWITFFHACDADTYKALAEMDPYLHCAYEELRRISTDKMLQLEYEARILRCRNAAVL